MTGTLINVGGIVAGALIGMLLRKGIPQHINDAIIKVEGLAIVIIGFNGVISAMFTLNPATGRLSNEGGLVLLVCLVLGCLIGEFLRIDDRICSFGRMVEQKSGAEGFAKGFVDASLVFSIGAMAIVGALDDGLRGDSSVLIIKSTLDFTTAIVLASALGIGVAFSAIPVFLLQGSISLLAGVISPYVSENLLNLFCMVGYAIVMVIGFNFLCDIKVKTANLLPALILPIIYYFARC